MASNAPSSHSHNILVLAKLSLNGFKILQLTPSNFLSTKDSSGKIALK
jgi:hypothetical protein